MVSEISYNSPLGYIPLGVAVTRLLAQSDPALSMSKDMQPVNVRNLVDCLADRRLMVT